LTQSVDKPIVKNVRAVYQGACVYLCRRESEKGLLFDIPVVRSEYLLPIDARDFSRKFMQRDLDATDALGPALCFPEKCQRGVGDTLNGSLAWCDR